MADDQSSIELQDHVMKDIKKCETKNTTECCEACMMVKVFRSTFLQ